MVSFFRVVVLVRDDQTLVVGLQGVRVDVQLLNGCQNHASVRSLHMVLDGFAHQLHVTEVVVMVVVVVVVLLL